MDIAATAVSMTSARLALDASMSVQRKALDAAKADGEQLIQALDSMPRLDSARGYSFDVRA